MVCVTPEQRYLRLLSSFVLNEVYEPGPHVVEGRIWPPGSALTMIGKKRINNIYKALEYIRVNNVEGDLFEAGVWRGGATIFMKGYLEVYNMVDKDVFLADSFQGIPAPDIKKYPSDEAHIGCDTLEILKNNSANKVIEAFERLDLYDEKIRIIEGWFEDTLHKIQLNKLSLLRIDGDTYQSTWEVLSALYSKLSSGGWVIIDDMSWEGCADAVRDFRRKYNINEKVIDIDWTGIYWIKS